MKNQTIALILANLLLFQFCFFVILQKNKIVLLEKNSNQVLPSVNKPELPPITNSISDANPSYLDYPKIVDQLKKWNAEAPEMTEIGTYGKSTKGHDLYYIRIHNRRFIQQEDHPRVLITACIHGNEPLATSTTMWYIGNLLKDYNSNSEIRDLLDDRDVYFVPVVSPDSYPTSRYVDGVDPNRNFPKGPDSTNKSARPVAALQDLFNTIKPQAVISAHTWGRVYLTPYGDQMDNCPDHDQFKKLVGKMSELSGYRNIRTCDMYRSNGRLNNPPIRTVGYDIGEYNVMAPIFGTEIDWYYRNNSFAIVMEMGTHQRIPSKDDIKIEFDMTYKAVLHFIKEAPLVKLKINSN
jgi:hypothetical protein